METLAARQSLNTQFIRNSIPSRCHKDFPGKIRLVPTLCTSVRTYTNIATVLYRLVASSCRPRLVDSGKPSDKLNRCVHAHRRDVINSVHTGCSTDLTSSSTYASRHRHRRRRRCTSATGIARRRTNASSNDSFFNWRSRRAPRKSFFLRIHKKRKHVSYQ